MTVQRFFEYSLLGMLTSAYMALATSGSVSPLPLALTGAALIARALMVAGMVRIRIPAAFTTGVTLAYIGFYAVDYFLISREFLQATVHLIFFLAVTKILTASTPRDYFYVKTIALLELLAASLFSGNASFFLFLGMFLLASVAAFASDEIRRSGAAAGSSEISLRRFPAGRLLLFTGWVSMGILVLTAGLFFLLPRTARAALQRFAPMHRHMAGFSREVDLGDIGEIQQQDSAVMHVRAEDGRPLPEGLKWRGATLAAFDGRRWFNPPGATRPIATDRRGLFILATPEQRRSQSPRLTYMVQMSEAAGDALFFPGEPEFLWIDAPYIVCASPGVYRRLYGSTGPATYQARSFLDPAPFTSSPETGPDPSPGPIYLQLPPLDPRVPSLARQITAGAPGPLAKARAIERYLPRHYRYTLELPAREPRDPLAHFLFERRKGHCEYFASAMAVMLRTLDIPSRVATGFQGGIYNPISRRQIVRGSDAHSWVEAWIPGRGWTAFDPTPADGGRAASIWGRLSLYADAADVFWQEWVLGYSLDHQILLASRMEDSGRRLGVNWPDAIVSSAGPFFRALLPSAARFGPTVLFAALVAALLLSFGPGAWRWWRARAGVRRALTRPRSPLRRGSALRTHVALPRPPRRRAPSLDDPNRIRPRRRGSASGGDRPRDGRILQRASLRGRRAGRLAHGRDPGRVRAPVEGNYSTATRTDFNSSPVCRESTTSWPLSTWPKIVCLPFNQSVTTCVMKNWLPLESGPALAIDRLPTWCRRGLSFTSSSKR